MVSGWCWTLINLISYLTKIEKDQCLAKLFRGKINVFIDGYNNDARELFQIGEVRKWVNSLLDNVSGLTYYLDKNGISQFLKIMFLCWNENYVIKGAEFVKNGLKHKCVEYNLQEKHKEFFFKLFDDLNTFCDKHHIPDSVNIEITDEIISSIFNNSPNKNFIA